MPTAETAPPESPPEGAPDLLVVAGEASGDQHGARLLSALRERRADLNAWGLGGEELRAAGLDAVADSGDISVVGIVEVLKIYRRAKEIFDLLLAEADRRGTRTALLIDAPGFNLRLAKALRAKGLRVIYYISPQVWAWRRGRVKTIARTVDRMLVLFPFEVHFYEQYGIEATCVGHPLVDEIPVLPQVWEHEEAGRVPTEAVVALLPGSRASEVRKLLPNMLDCAARLAAERPIRARLIRARSLPDEIFDTALAACPVPVEVIREDRYQAVADSHVALCASGTATLEVGLLGTPMLVVYRLTTASYWLGKLLVRLPWFSLVNLVLERKVAPELLQRDADPPRLAAAALALLEDRSRIDAMRVALAELRPRLGEGGASVRAAREVLPWLRPPRTVSAEATAP